MPAAKLLPTGGTAGLLGPVGNNFAAGMTGGMAFVYDPEERLPFRINDDSVIYQRVQTEHWESVVNQLIVSHWRETQSSFAERLLVDWAQERDRFWQVVPKEMVDRLEEPLTAEAAERRA